MAGTIYIGIDLGDKTTALNEAKSGASNEAIDIALPGNTGNEPLQSAVGYMRDGGTVLADRFEDIPPDHFALIAAYFKRRPTSLVSISKGEIEAYFGGGERVWPQHADLDTSEMKVFREGAKDLLDLIMQSDETTHALEGLLVEADEIVFCVGYPTNWDAYDLLVYQRIVRMSILGAYEAEGSYLGKPMRLMFERESTAAFVYVKLLGSTMYTILDTDKILLLDFGSSTVNVTAMTTDARETIYHSGHNFFGGRLLDCVIAEYFLEQVTGEERQLLEALDSNNNGIGTMLLLLEASKAKESLSMGTRARISILDMHTTVRLNRDILNELLQRPLAPIIKKHSLIPESELLKFGEDGWREILRKYLVEEKEKLNRDGIIPDKVILAGGGALFYAIQELCGEIFSDSQLLDARESTKNISKGLALSAKQVDISMQFDRDIRAFIDNRLSEVIEREVPALSGPLSEKIADYICEELIIGELIRWREGCWDTLDETTERIRSRCSEDKFRDLLKTDRAIKEAVSDWSINHLGHAISRELEMICMRYAVKGFDVKELNVIAVPTVDVQGTVLVPASEMDFMAKVIAGITGVVAAVIAPGLLVLVLQIIAMIMPFVAGTIAGIILAIPGGIFIVAGVAGVAVIKLVRDGWQSVREKVLSGIVKAKIPDFARKAVTENRIRESVNKGKPEIQEKINESISGGDNKHNISQQMKDVLAEQIRVKMESIRYILETE